MMIVIDVSDATEVFYGFVSGTPVPQGSKQAFVVGHRAVLVDVNKVVLKPWRAAIASTVAALYKGERLDDRPVTVIATFYLPRPASVTRPEPHVRPDLDKLQRALFDGLTDSGIWKDDCQACEMFSSKVYAATPEVAGVLIRIFIEERSAMTTSPTSRLTFNKAGHAYKLDKKPIDGVTTLIGDGMRKKALEFWSANETAAYAVNHWEELTQLPVATRLDKLKKSRFEVRDLAARRGTEVHRLAELLAHGQDVEVPDEIKGHVESAVAFLDEWQIRPVLTETKVWNENGHYGGTLDMVVTSDLMPGVVALADWKTSRSGIYGETALQLSAYEHADCYIGADGADHPMAELGITDCWGVWIRPDGYEVYSMTHDIETFRTFQFVATVARRTGNNKLEALKSEALFRPVAVAS